MLRLTRILVVAGEAMSADGEFQPFVHDVRTGVMTQPPTVGGSAGDAKRIDRTGVVVGRSPAADGASHATAWIPDTWHRTWHRTWH